MTWVSYSNMTSGISFSATSITIATAGIYRVTAMGVVVIPPPPGVPLNSGLRLMLNGVEVFPFQTRTWAILTETNIAGQAIINAPAASVLSLRAIVSGVPFDAIRLSTVSIILERLD